MAVNLPIMYPQMLREQKLLPKPVKPSPWSEGALKPVEKKDWTNREDSYRTVCGMGREWRSPQIQGVGRSLRRSKKLWEGRDI